MFSWKCTTFHFNCPKNLSSNFRRCFDRWKLNVAWIFGRILCEQVLKLYNTYTLFLFLTIYQSYFINLLKKYKCQVYPFSWKSNKFSHFIFLFSLLSWIVERIESRQFWKKWKIFNFICNEDDRRPSLILILFHFGLS